MSVFIGYPSFMAYQMMKGKKGNNDGFPSIPGMIARYSALGLTNEQMAENPIWVDKTGNGHDLQLKNFSWKGMSGIGGYVVDIDEWGTNSTAAYFERNSIKITATFKENASLGLLYHNIKLRQSCVLKVTGIPEGCDAFLDDRLGNRFYMSEDGVYEIIPSNFLAEALYLSIEKYPERWYGSKLTIEQIPEYEGYLVTDGVDDKITSSDFKIGKDFTIVGDWKFIIDENKGCGLVKVPKLYIYNSKTGLDIYINSNSIKNILSGIKGLNAVCSDGRVYDCNWNEISVKYGNMVDINSSFLITNSGNIFTKMAFKNLGIYNNQLLSKDDCIKAYNYLQTLKAK